MNRRIPMPIRSPSRRPRIAALAAVLIACATVLGFRTPPATSTALFAGGCFWSMQKAFDGIPGVTRVTAGYAGGTLKDPSYEQVETGLTGHAESVQVIYEPARISYDSLLLIYWHHTDPTTPNQAFCDRGPQYRSIIFYDDEEQKREAEASKAALDRSGRFRTAVVTAIQPATAFYAAEEYHQQFYRKNPERYEAYRIGCRRDARMKELWGDLAAPREASR
jgi:peptide-methionine (S)-S-oxide reductase